MIDSSASNGDGSDLESRRRNDACSNQFNQFVGFQCNLGLIKKADRTGTGSLVSYKKEGGYPRRRRRELRVSLQSEMERELMEADIVVPSPLSFKKIQSYQKYPKGQSTRRWKHLKQILQAENFHDYPPDLPTYVNIESPPSTQPCKRICDITGYEAPYVDPRTNLRYANTHVFKTLRSLSSDQVHQYLSLRNAAVVLK